MWFPLAKQEFSHDLCRPVIQCSDRKSKKKNEHGLQPLRRLPLRLQGDPWGSHRRSYSAEGGKEEAAAPAAGAGSCSSHFGSTERPDFDGPCSESSLPSRAKQKRKEKRQKQKQAKQARKPQQRTATAAAAAASPQRAASPIRSQASDSSSSDREPTTPSKKRAKHALRRALREHLAESGSIRSILKFLEKARKSKRHRDSDSSSSDSESDCSSSSGEGEVRLKRSDLPFDRKLLKDGLGSMARYRLKKSVPRVAPSPGDRRYRENPWLWIILGIVQIQDLNDIFCGPNVYGLWVRSFKESIDSAMKSVSDTLRDQVVRALADTLYHLQVQGCSSEWPHIELMMENKIAMANSLMDVVKAAMARRQKK